MFSRLALFPVAVCQRLAIAFVVLALLASVSCSSPDESTTDAATPTALPDGRRPQREYRAEWLVDAEAIGADGPGFPFAYREIVDDRLGLYLVQGPQHLATQNPDEVVFCAAIFRGDPYCAASERASTAPNVLSYPVQLLRGWGPIALYDLAGWREVDLAASVDTESWNRRTTVSNRGINVECFVVVGATTAANPGFEVCFTDDAEHLVANVDLQGDGFYEVELVRYESNVGFEDFVTGLEESVEQKASLQEQLLRLFPEVPAPRPTAVPTIETADS